MRLAGTPRGTACKRWDMGPPAPPRAVSGRRSTAPRGEPVARGPHGPQTTRGPRAPSCHSPLSLEGVSFASVSIICLLPGQDVEPGWAGLGLAPTGPPTRPGPSL